MKTFSSNLKSDIFNFADDDTLHACRPTIKVRIQMRVKTIDLQFAITWFNMNSLVLKTQRNFKLSFLVLIPAFLCHRPLNFH